ncbi:MAG TPA: hypothetical protein VI790_00385 [Candidatus Nanoarchaeia archaeon]|nr:hypothetical protein [Candidatus Nanoarchaeia archaeon]
MGSLKAILVNDYNAGSNIFSYINSDSKTDPNLISGMFKALDMMSREFLGGGFSSIAYDNGLKVLFGNFFIKHFVVNKYLKLDPGFRFTEPLVKKSPNEFYIESSVPDDFVGSRFVFDDLFSKLDSKPAKFSVFDYASKALIYSIDYKPRISYALSDMPGEFGVNYCLIFDSVDESFDNGSFVRSKFSELSDLIKSNVDVFGPALLQGDISLVDSTLKPLVDDFVVKYNNVRFNLFGDKIVSDMANLPNLNDTKKLEVLSGAKSIFSVLNGSAKYLPKGRDNC